MVYSFDTLEQECLALHNIVSSIIIKFLFTSFCWLTSLSPPFHQNVQMCLLLASLYHYQLDAQVIAVLFSSTFALWASSAAYELKNFLSPHPTQLVPLII